MTMDPRNQQAPITVTAKTCTTDMATVNSQQQGFAMKVNTGDIREQAGHKGPWTAARRKQVGSRG